MHRRPHLSLPSRSGGARRVGRWTATGLALAALGWVTAACSAGGSGSGPAGTITAAPLASGAACAAALGHAPATVLGRPAIRVDVPGARAWGDPAIVLRCGLPEPGPTAAPCVNVDGVDWVIEDPAADPIVFETFGRSPAIDVRVPASYGRQNASAALVDLAPMAAALPRTAHACLG